MASKRESKNRTSGIVLIAFLFAFIFLGNDIVGLSLRPLKYLGIGFPPVLAYTHFIAPAIALALLVVFGRRCPEWVILALCVVDIMAISAVAKWADKQIDKVQITRWINDIKPLEGRLGFQVWEIGNASGDQLWVARGSGRVQRLTAEAKQMGIFPR
jgi:hypothetical protein